MKSKNTKEKIQTQLPVYSLEGVQHPVLINAIEERSPYDTTREHRHDYFEILFFQQGGGSQLIDFKEWPLVENSCYIIYPRQIHLMKRGLEANGEMLQFHESSIISPTLKNALCQLSYNANSTIIFENNKEKKEKFQKMIAALKEVTKNTSLFSNEMCIHYLQAFLLQLLEGREESKGDSPSADKKLLVAFQYLLEKNFQKIHTVKVYAAELKATEKKLTTITKQFIGLSPLQVIHNRLLLEAKRLLLFESSSHKEIAYQLGFDSPATFSQFIKTRTGYNPSDLHHHLVDIHK